jgi:hypothetical protein
MPSGELGEYSSFFERKEIQVRSFCGMYFFRRILNQKAAIMRFNPNDWHSKKCGMTISFRQNLLKSR